MSTAIQPSQEQSDTVSAETTQNDAPSALDALTSAMIGGAPQAEIDQLRAEYDASLRPAPQTETPAPAVEGVPSTETTDPEAQVVESGTATDEKPAESTPEPGAQPTPAEEKGDFRLRFNHLQPEEQVIQRKIHALTHEGFTLVEATQIAMRDKLATSPLVSASSPTPEADPELEQSRSTTVAELESTVQDLERQIDEAASGEGLYGPDAARLTKELSRANAALAVARSEAVMAEREQATYVASLTAQRNTVLKNTIEDYPDMAKRDSVQFRLAAQLSREAADPSHPNHEQSLSVEAPNFFAVEAARLLNLKPKNSAPASKPSTPANEATPPASAPKPGPVSGSRQTLPPSPEQSAADRVKAGERKTLAVIGGMPADSAEHAGDVVLVL
jgi:hypothetical protein